MDKNKQKEYLRYVGLGMILGVAIGSSIEFMNGNFLGITAASGAGIGIVIGSIIGHVKIKSK